MRSIVNYILNESHNTSYELKSHITDSPKKFNSDFIVNSAEWIQSRFPILLKYAKEISNKRKHILTDSQDIEFVNKWVLRCSTAYEKNETGKTSNTQADEFLYLCNGEKPYFGNAKFTYDLLQYALTRDDLTKPARQKIQKLLREYYSEVDKHKNEMNWY